MVLLTTYWYACFFVVFRYHADDALGLFLLCICRAAASNPPLSPVQVTAYVGFCTTPSDRRQPRHEAKKTTKGHCQVPKGKVDGTEVDGFDRTHVYGVLGILITMGITQKRRMTDHWGTSQHDNYPLIRTCMPRDLFLLFYSRFFHMASAAPVDKGHEDYDSKHHIRYINRKIR